MSGADGYIHFMQMDGTVILVYMRVFSCREKDGCRQYYGSLMNVTEVQADKKQAEVQTQITDRAFNEDYESLEAHFGKMPTGFCIDRLILDENNKPVDYEILYANETMRQVCTGDLEQLKALSYQSFGDKVEEAYTYMYNAAYKGEKKTFYLLQPHFQPVYAVYILSVPGRLHRCDYTGYYEYIYCIECSKEYAAFLS